MPMLRSVLLLHGVSENTDWEIHEVGFTALRSDEGMTSSSF